LDTEIGGPAGAFPPTRASLSPERLIALYWKPIYCLIRRGWAASNEEAKDLTQDFFLTEVLGRSLLSKFSRERGSLRSFLKGAVRGFLSNARRTARRQKRYARTVSMEGVDLASTEPSEPADVQAVLARLKSLVRPKVFKAFTRFTFDDASYKKIAAELKITLDDVRNYLRRARQALTPP
jgi:RNA polymerase sigma factor (sigma-70 family)